MKKSLLIIACVLFFNHAKAQLGPISANIGHIDTLYSTILKEKRPLLIYTPVLDTTFFTKVSYPVLYVLDGDSHFMSLMAMINQLSVINGNTSFPEMIIVGIPNTNGNRNRDLTPSKSTTFQNSGGGENFTQFLSTELIPYINKNYSTAPYQILVGHSLGGLTVVHNLLNHSNLFNAYVAIDPSLFYNHDDLLKQAEVKFKETKFNKTSFFLAAANTARTGMDTSNVKLDTNEYNHHMRSILKFSDILKTNRNDELKWNFKYYPDEDHISVPLIAEYDALKFIFRDNKFPNAELLRQFFDKNSSNADLQKLIKTHYDSLSKEMGYEIRASEKDMNNFGYMFLQQKEYNKAAFFFQVNIDYFPGSFNAYDSMGDYFLAKGEKQNAIKYFKKALSLKYRADIKTKLEKLNSEH
ncbi:alpha/beta hydrolase-fold protein [Pedobacter nototheniae]|uniref:alpha/beta hydrolase-fold protein n=1 Tax=Pedobacter nototheniae TaxID=2488994 RepID=UPI00292F83CA|nr:alpha/beta hydrolase-fold protein [Pedobacter nototheniae]